MDQNPAIILPLVGMSIPLVLVPIILGFRHEKQKRDKEHAERMRALELGRSLPGDEPWFSPAKICVIIGGGVPVGVFGIAWMAAQSVGYHEEMFILAGMVGVTAVICGTLLASKWFDQRAQAESAGTTTTTTFTKPVIDEDAYDVTGARG